MLGFLIITGGLGLLMILERLYPDQPLAKVDGWWKRVLFINFCQLVMVVGSMYTLEKWLQIPSIFNLRNYVSPPIGGFITYLISTWIFYWWHLLRHEIYLLWLTFHQMHHSAQRIETITSFYKHPLEIFIDSLIMIVLMYPILGLTNDSSIWLSAFAAYGEYFYHMNIKTPKWLGYFFQRPESHRVHHFRNKRFCFNYSDFPFWDMLGGTFYNPDRSDVPTGYEPENETKFTDILLFKDVLAESNSNKSNHINHKTKVPQIFTMTNILSTLLLCIGCIQPIGYLFNFKEVRGLGLISVASPLPLVFSAYNGVETFSTSFTLNITHFNASTLNGDTLILPLTRDLYSQIRGPYNLRNTYGVMFSHGPFFNTPELIALRQHMLDYMICKGALVFHNYRSLNIEELNIIIHSNTKGNENKQWSMSIKCD